MVLADRLLRKPITGKVGCCARAASGHRRRRAAEQRDELAPSHVEHNPPSRNRSQASSRNV